MRALKFILAVKAIVLTPVTFVILCSTTPVAGQIDYQAHPQIIDTKTPVVKIDWLTSSPKKCPINFNHLVNFIPTGSESPNSTVIVDLYQNENIVRSFTFPVGEVTNRIYTFEDLQLKKGDHVYFVFTLKPTTPDEEYVFNIYEEHRAPIKTIKVIDQKGVRIVESKPVEIKHKDVSSSRHFRKMQRQPIGREF